MKHKWMPFLLFFFGFSLSAHAQTFTAELARIDTLRAVFGNQVVNVITSLPPDQYKQARDEALALADRVKNNAFARDDAKAQLCASFERYGRDCPQSDEAVSGVDKKRSAETD